MPVPAPASPLYCIVVLMTHQARLDLVHHLLLPLPVPPPAAGLAAGVGTALLPGSGAAALAVAAGAGRSSSSVTPVAAPGRQDRHRQVRYQGPPAGRAGRPAGAGPEPAL